MTATSRGTRGSTSSTALYRRFLPLLHPYRGRLLMTLAATLARPALNAAKVWLLKVLIDDVVRGHQPSLLPLVCAAYLGIALAKGLVAFGDDSLGGWVGANVVRDLRGALYDHLQGLSLRFYYGQRLGDLLSRLTGDIGAIEELLVSGVTDTLAHVLTILVFLAMLWYLDTSLALVALAVIPLLALATVSYARRTRSIQQAIREKGGVLTSVAEEGLSAIALVKAFAREPFEQERFRQASSESLRARLRSVRTRTVFTPLIELVATIGTVLVVWLGSQSVLSGQLTLGGLVVFLGYLGSLYTPIQGLSLLGGTVQRALAGAQRVAEVLDAEPSAQERRAAALLPAVRGLVEFREVRFGYSADRPVLRDFNLTIRQGETLALVGASGAGKTTVVSLLLAYYDPDAGTISIDGHDFRDFDPPSIRRRIAAVLQEPMLFQTSVRENIRYGRLEATDAEIEAAAVAAGADDFIREMAQGYETPTGPRGARLSGGQRQRLAIARALLAEASVLVLDEATSALDPITESIVLASLRTSKPACTTLLVTHRLSTARRADRIALLSGGRVAELGSHEELMRSRGLYYQFFLEQTPAAFEPAAATVGSSGKNEKSPKRV
ncbi:MAG: ABC transporter ATP-binding protein/permease [Chloroflexi bacterium]|nr:ABC transporter ATP-binding protein/permease [Chloroflexota bacterium]